MVVCAHPDDAEIGTGATVAKWIEGGCEVVYVVCTDGSGGSNDDDMTSDRTVAGEGRGVTIRQCGM